MFSLSNELSKTVDILPQLKQGCFIYDRPSLFYTWGEIPSSENRQWDDSSPSG